MQRAVHGPGERCWTRPAGERPGRAWLPRTGTGRRDRSGDVPWRACRVPAPCSRHAPPARGRGPRKQPQARAAAASAEIPGAALARRGRCVLAICGRSRRAARRSPAHAQSRSRRAARRGCLREGAGPALSRGASSLPVAAVRPPGHVARGSRPRLPVRVATGTAPLVPEFRGGGRARRFLVPPAAPGRTRAPRAGTPLVLGSQPGVRPPLGAGAAGLGGGRQAPEGSGGRTGAASGSAPTEPLVFVDAAVPAGPHGASCGPARGLCSDFTSLSLPARSPQPFSPPVHHAPQN